MNITIAAVQFEIAQFAPEENLSKAERYIAEAAASHAHIIVFPEDFVTGPIHGRSEFADYEGRYVRHFQALAKKYAIDIVPGSIIEGDAQGLYNTAYYIDNMGIICGTYRKVNLWHPERPYITAGKQVSAFDTAYGKVGLIICWDLMFPEVFRTMVKQGVEMVICPSYWCFEDAGVGMQYDTRAEITLVNALCVARAFEQEIVLVYVNAAGSNGSEEDLIGHSQITVPFKGAIARLEHTKEAMVLQEVNTSILKDAEQAYLIRADLLSGSI
ncbi:MAG: carbon-nitrogen hydrolase family protein [Chloroflexota bacterium]|nr:carbon-nitrogen hydrolase family protein [Chloroflexota bacterium]